MSAADVEADVRARVAAIRERIDAAARRAGRSPDAVRLIGVSKRQPVERIVAALRAGVVDLGESYVQEARDKLPRVAAALAPDDPRPHWRMVGRLQRNKAKLAASLFEAVDSVDRAELAVDLDRRARAAGRGPDDPLELLIQVSLCGEPQKGGVEPEGLPEMLRACAALESARVVGLMTIPAADPDPESARRVFARLRELRDTLAADPGGRGLRELSMGMSGDFESAIEEGATQVRVGTALFGPRTDAREEQA